MRSPSAEARWQRTSRADLASSCSWARRQGDQRFPQPPGHLAPGISRRKRRHPGPEAVVGQIAGVEPAEGLEVAADLLAVGCRAAEQQRRAAAAQRQTDAQGQEPQRQPGAGDHEAGGPGDDPAR